MEPPWKRIARGTIRAFVGRHGIDAKADWANADGWEWNGGSALGELGQNQGMRVLLVL